MTKSAGREEVDPNVDPHYIGVRGRDLALIARGINPDNPEEFTWPTSRDLDGDEVFQQDSGGLIVSKGFSREAYESFLAEAKQRLLEPGMREPKSVERAKLLERHFPNVYGREGSDPIYSHRSRGIVQIFDRRYHEACKLRERR